MDEAVIKYYRVLLRTGFPHAGTIESPTILLDAVGENLPICDQVGRDSLQLFLNIRDGVIEDIKYLCTCDPTTNVAVEIMCALAKARRLDELQTVTGESFSSVLGSHSDDLLKKANGLMELLNRGIRRYLAQMPNSEP